MKKKAEETPVKDDQNILSDKSITSKIDAAIQNLITGTVSDATGPLPGVSVIIKGTK